MVKGEAATATDEPKCARAGAREGCARALGSREREV